MSDHFSHLERRAVNLCLGDFDENEFHEIAVYFFPRCNLLLFLSRVVHR